MEKLDLDKKITDFHIQEFRDWRNQVASLNLGAKYINGKILGLMRNVLQIAVKECGIDDRFPDAIKNIQTNSGNKVNEYIGDEQGIDPNDVVDNHWEEDEFKQFISFVDDPKYKLLFETLFFTGLRIGELRALKFGDIRKVKKEWKLTIYNTYTNDNKKLETKQKI